MKSHYCFLLMTWQSTGCHTSKEKWFSFPIAIAVSSYYARARVSWASLIHTGLLTGRSPCRSCPPRLQWIPESNGIHMYSGHMSGRHILQSPCSSSPFSSNILYVFCSSVFSEPWNGYLDVLFRAEHSDSFSALWLTLSLYVNHCPLQKETFLTKVDSPTVAVNINI